MPRINLLPWREELRKERQRNFAVAAAGAVLIGAAAVFGAKSMVNGQIEHQVNRNDMLKAEIKRLDEQIGEIRDLESKKERLLARMQIIEQLQRSRPEVVHLFDELARTLPDGVHLDLVKQAGKRITLRGKAQSSTRVSAYMRNIDRSAWLTDPGLDVVETKDTGPSRSSEFTIFAEQTNPRKVEEEDDS
ncbi:MAG: PilN domain-containing protein [Gammaproteobacteria bacterium]|nr:PilN domain-containing protein [Gammaproteobacteria bacterium]NNF62222.1 PilN domain-containing protein [Gammaproteobacteria bacterium]NNM21019.1 PilN domain-containing protein [Gammaproteobacteria bacterium]